MSKIENPFDKKTDPEIAYIFESLVGLKNRVGDTISKAEKLAGFSDSMTFSPLEQVKVNLPALTSLRNPSISYYSSSKTVSLNVVEQQAKEAIEIAKLEIERVNKFNEPLIRRNQEIADKIKELMSKIGIPQSYTTYEYPTTRSKTKKTVYHTAGYIGDLQRIVPTSNTYSASLDVQRYEQSLVTWMKIEKDKELQEAIKNDEKVVANLITLQSALVEILMKNGVNVLSEINKAVPGKKSEIIKYSVALALSNIENIPGWRDNDSIARDHSALKYYKNTL